MSLHAGEIAASLAELAPLAVGARLDRVHQPTATTLILELRQPTETVRVLLGARPDASRINLALRPWAKKVPLGSFGALVRRELEGRRLVAVDQPGVDRLVVLSFAPAEGADYRPDRVLHAELLGRHANLFVVALDGTDPPRILGALQASHSTRRDLRVGGIYQPPPSPVERRAEPPSRFAPPGVSEQIEAHYALVEQKGDEDRLRSRIQQALRARLARVQRRSEAVTRDLGRFADADGDRRRGELILAYKQTLARGQTGAVLDDFDGTPMAIALDPAKSPLENAERYFARFKKARQGVAIARQRLAEAAEEATRLEGWLTTAGSVGGTELARLAERLGLVVAKPQAAPKRTKKEPAHPFREFVGKGGEPILVGKGAEDNDRLTFRHARGNDLWLHVRDAKGAHVVIQLRKGQPAHPETVIDAAMLAAHYSDLRSEAQVDVTAAPCKYLKKGGAPGAVYVGSGRTVRVRQDQERLARIFAGRKDRPPEDSLE